MDPFALFKQEEIESELIECIQIFSYPGTRAARYRQIREILVQMERDWRQRNIAYKIMLVKGGFAPRPKGLSTYFYRVYNLVKDVKLVPRRERWNELEQQLNNILQALHERGIDVVIEIYRNLQRAPTAVVDLDVKELAQALETSDLPGPIGPKENG